MTVDRAETLGYMWGLMSAALGYHWFSLFGYDNSALLLHNKCALPLALLWAAVGHIYMAPQPQEGNIWYWFFEFPQLVVHEFPLNQLFSN